MKNKVFLDIHVLQTVPPSCLNRDDTGSPKSAVYGGVTRSRVSSQCWKKAMRDFFKDHTDALGDELGKNIGIRSKKMVSEIVKAMLALSPELTQEDAELLALEAMQVAGLATAPKGAAKSKKAKKVDEDATTDGVEEETEGEKDLLSFLSRQQIEDFAKVVCEAPTDIAGNKKQLVAVLKENKSLDLALFGRMVASNPELSVEACAHVAQIISTHRVNTEYDFFAATDDIAGDSHAGSAHLGVVEYNSGTLYRYATVAVHELFKELSTEPKVLEVAIREFIRAFVLSMPTGKQSTMAAHTKPDAVMISVRTDSPINMAAAFEKPVTGSGIVEASVKAFEGYVNAVYEDWGNPVNSYIVGRHLAPTMGTKISFKDDADITALSKTVVEKVLV